MFQTMMNEIFGDLILIFSEDMELHQKTVDEVSKIMEKPEKCEFHLGLIIGHRKLHMDPVKVEGIHNWELPTCVKDMQSFLGFTNFYWKFICNYLGLAWPMVDLTKKDCK